MRAKWAEDFGMMQRTGESFAAMDNPAERKAVLRRDVLASNRWRNVWSVFKILMEASAAFANGKGRGVLPLKRWLPPEHALASAWAQKTGWCKGLRWRF